MYAVYKFLTYSCALPISILLKRRLIKGKESSRSLDEKKGLITLPKPHTPLLWIHAASVGEAQSALILINRILEYIPNVSVLVTTGTLTSAQLMQKKLPDGAFHQFYPLDHPVWVKKFLDHWQPNVILWMESELWPNMLHEIKARKILVALINARMSQQSFKTWKRFLPLAKSTLRSFHKILCQTESDKNFYDRLGAQNTIVTDNLKHSAEPLQYSDDDFKKLKQACNNRTLWLYASTHDGEEQIAHEIHKDLKKTFANLLTIIVPRHPERREQIKASCDSYGFKTTYRGSGKSLPEPDDDIYIADTLGELGLFYKLSPVSCIGRSLSNDGGGGHNPIEAVQLGSGVLYGKNVQNLQTIYDEITNDGAAIKIENAQSLHAELTTLLSDPIKLTTLQKNGEIFSKKKADVIDNVIKEIEPILRVLQNDEALQPHEKLKQNAS